MQDLRSKTILAMRWTFTAQVSTTVVNFLISITLARLLSPREFGLLGMVAVFIGFANVFSDMGFGAAIIPPANYPSSTDAAVCSMRLILTKCSMT